MHNREKSLFVPVNFQEETQCFLCLSLVHEAKPKYAWVINDQCGHIFHNNCLEHFRQNAPPAIRGRCPFPGCKSFLVGSTSPISSIAFFIAQMFGKARRTPAVMELKKIQAVFGELLEIPPSLEEEIISDLNDIMSTLPHAVLRHRAHAPPDGDEKQEQVLPLRQLQGLAEGLSHEALRKAAISEIARVYHLVLAAGEKKFFEGDRKIRRKIKTIKDQLNGNQPISAYVSSKLINNRVIAGLFHKINNDFGNDHARYMGLHSPVLEEVVAWVNMKFLQLGFNVDDVPPFGIVAEHQLAPKNPFQLAIPAAAPAPRQRDTCDKFFIVMMVFLIILIFYFCARGFVSGRDIHPQENRHSQNSEQALIACGLGAISQNITRLNISIPTIMGFCHQHPDSVGIFLQAWKELPPQFLTAIRERRSLFAGTIS
ncbi:MAG: hypothetical protein K0S63_1263 [Gammaproteobacteria bacterium]|nr:hypothetical protein [Gammaproteobacteria bacterium]